MVRNLALDRLAVGIKQVDETTDLKAYSLTKIFAFIAKKSFF